MDQLTSFRPFEQAQEPRAIVARSPIRRLIRWTVASVLLVAILAVGYRLGKSEFALPGWVPAALVELLGGRVQSPASEGAVIYYRDPGSRSLPLGELSVGARLPETRQ